MIHVLLRPLTPRHPPCALSSLTTFFFFRRCFLSYSVFNVPTLLNAELAVQNAELRIRTPSLFFFPTHFSVYIEDFRMRFGVRTPYPRLTKPDIQPQRLQDTKKKLSTSYFLCVLVVQYPCPNDKNFAGKVLSLLLVLALLTADCRTRNAYLKFVSRRYFCFQVQIVKHRLWVQDLHPVAASVFTQFWRVQHSHWSVKSGISPCHSVSPIPTSAFTFGRWFVV